MARMGAETKTAQRRPDRRADRLARSPGRCHGQPVLLADIRLGLRPVRKMLFQKARRQHGIKGRVLQDLQQQRAVGKNALDAQLRDARAGVAHRLCARGGKADHLGQHRVVIGRDLTVRMQPAVNPHTGQALRLAIAEQRPEAGAEIVRGLFRVEPALYRPAGARDRFLAQRQRFAAGAAQLPLHEVDAGRHLGHRVLHLQPGVDFQEVGPVALIGVEHELHRARVVVVHGAAHAQGRFIQTLGHGWRHVIGRRFLDHLLKAALDRALALEQVHQSAMAIPHELHFEVARVDDVFLQQHALVAKGGLRFALGQCQQRQEFRCVIDAAHALAATACAGLDQQRKADALRLALQALRRLVVLVVTGHTKYAGGARHALALDLGAHGCNCTPVRADEGDAVGLTGVDQFELLRQEAVAGVDRLRAALQRRCDDAIGAQIGVARAGLTNGDGVVGLHHVAAVGVSRGIDGNGLDTQAPAGAQDAARNFAAVGDQQSFEHGLTSGRRVRDPRRAGWRAPGPEGTGPAHRAFGSAR